MWGSGGASPTNRLPWQAWWCVELSFDQSKVFCLWRCLPHTVQHWRGLHMKRPVQLPSQMEVHGSTNPPLQSQQCVVSEFQGQVLSICEHLHANFVLQLCISWSPAAVLSQLGAVHCVGFGVPALNPKPRDSKTT